MSVCLTPRDSIAEPQTHLVCECLAFCPFTRFPVQTVPWLREKCFEFLHFTVMEHFLHMVWRLCTLNQTNLVPLWLANIFKQPCIHRKVLLQFSHCWWHPNACAHMSSIIELPVVVKNVYSLMSVLRGAHVINKCIKITQQGAALFPVTAVRSESES